MPIKIEHLDLERNWGRLTMEDISRKAERLGQQCGQLTQQELDEIMQDPKESRHHKHVVQKLHERYNPILIERREKLRLLAESQGYFYIYDGCDLNWRGAIMGHSLLEVKKRKVRGHYENRAVVGFCCGGKWFGETIEVVERYLALPRATRERLVRAAIAYETTRR